jgi:cyclohexadienyl dehydratase
MVVLGLAMPLGSRAAQFTTETDAVLRVFEIADQRLALMPAVAAIKWQTQAPVYDAARENAVIDKAQQLASPMGLGAEPVKQLFGFQARLAREVQSSLHEDWKAHGFTYGEPLASLSSIRPELDRITTDLLQALYLAAPALGREDFEKTFAASAAQRLRSFGWTDQNRRELLDRLREISFVPAPAPGRISSSGLLRIGTTGDYAPFSLDSNGALDGSDIKLAEELAASLHVRAVFVHTTWASLTADLGRNAFDMAIGGISITPAREAQGAFSVPYASGGKTILSRCADVPKFRRGLPTLDHPEVRVIVNPGGTNEQFVRDHIRRAKILVFPDNRGVFDELEASRADVMITDDVEAMLQSRRHPGLCRAFAGTLTHSDKAIYLPRDPDLVRAVDDWLQPRVAAGEPARLINEYLR